MATNIPSALARHKRSAWKPLVVDNDGPLTASKFSGTPWLERADSWPRCLNCGKPMQLFVQLNLDELPEAVQGEFGHGLMQMFYCTSQEPLCEVDCEAFFPFAKSVLARIIQPEADVHYAENPEIDNPFPPRLIVGWEETDDYPNYEEGESLGVELEVNKYDELEEVGIPRSGDKLAGWPRWVQGVEYPNCPLCGEPMRLLFQLDSDDNLPYLFGDIGRGHITQCKNHKDQLAFGWACG